MTSLQITTDPHKDLMRHVRKSFPDKILYDASFEPDEAGKPYFAVSSGRYAKYRSGKIVEGVILVDVKAAKRTPTKSKLFRNSSIRSIPPK